MFNLLCTEYVCVYQVAVQCSIYFVPNMFVFIRSLCNVLNIYFVPNMFVFIRSLCNVQFTLY